METNNSKRGQGTDKYLCPICGRFRFDDLYDICEVCFWEYDPIQADEPFYAGGANHLCVNDYKKWWNKLNEIMPALMEKYNVKKSDRSLWTYDEMIVPRESIKNFVEEITRYNIQIRLSFYHVCDKYGYECGKFVGYPYVYEDSIVDANKESLNIVFTDNPLKTCERYHLKQLLEILNKSDGVLKTWEKLTPHISIEPNPEQVPKE